MIGAPKFGQEADILALPPWEQRENGLWSKVRQTRDPSEGKCGEPGGAAAPVRPTCRVTKSAALADTAAMSNSSAGVAHWNPAAMPLYDTTDCTRINTGGGSKPNVNDWDRAKQQLAMLLGVKLAELPPPPPPSQDQVRAAIVEAAVAAGFHTAPEEGTGHVFVWKAAVCPMDHSA